MEILPKAAGAAIGAALGIAGEEALKPMISSVWGFVFAKLPFVSSRKLLIRAVRAEQATAGALERTLRAIWRVPSPY